MRRRRVPGAGAVIVSFRSISHGYHLCQFNEFRRASLAGHRAGDECFIHVSDVVRQTVRDVDICARYGGEEFVVILPQCSRENAIQVAERLREAISSSPIKRLGQRVDQVTATVGVSTCPAPAKTADELIEMADRAMYLAKAAGRNRVRTLFRSQQEEVWR